VADFIESLADAIPSDIRKDVERELLHGWRMQEVGAKADAKQLAIYNNAREAKPIEGVGQLRCRIPVSAYHYWGKRLGYECWQDKQFLDEFERDNPEVAVRNRVKRTMVGGAKGIFDANGFLHT
jgi:hypothetical protein